MRGPWRRREGELGAPLEGPRGGGGGGGGVLQALEG